MIKIDAIVREDRMEDVKDALQEINIHGMTISQVMGCGTQMGYSHMVRGEKVCIKILPKVKFEIVVSDREWAEKTVDAITKVAYTGEHGDGKIFLYEVMDVVRIRTKERGMHMKRDVKTCVIPFSKLEKAAYEYCRRDNHISDETSEKRREKFELQAEQVWDKIKHAKIQVDLVFLEEEKAGETVFQREWLLKHVGKKELPFRVCLYHLGIVQEFPREEKSSLQFMQDTWCI